jgi:biopolymer transport protein ExbB
MLAEGISLALVATATGLAIAIVAAASYYFLLGRVDRLIQDMDILANQFVSHVAAGGKGSENVGHVRPRVVPAREQASG